MIYFLPEKVIRYAQMPVDFLKGIDTGDCSIYVKSQCKHK